MAAAGVVVRGSGGSVHTPGAGVYSTQSPIEQRGTPFSVTSRLSNGERPQSAEPLTRQRVVSAASLGSAPVANDKSCCPSLKACFEKVWSAVKWFFNLLVEFFVDLCCPKSPLQLLESNKALVEILQALPDDVNLEAIQNAFKAMPEKAQLRIAVAAYDNYQVGAFQPPVLSAQDKLNRLLSGSWAIYPMLRRFLNSEEGPAPHTSQHQSGGAASSISLSGSTLRLP